GHIVYTLAAGNPRWIENDQTDKWVNPVDTTVPDGQGNPVWSEGSVKVWNPTDQTIWLKWVIQAYPGAVYRLPDWSVGDDTHRRAEEDVDRAIVMPELTAGEHLTVNTHAEEDQVVSNIDTEVWQRMNGVTFCYGVPPYTGTAKNPIVLPVAVT